MGLKITGLSELRERLERLRPEEVMAKALVEQAQRIAARVREGLSEPPGGIGHDEPWLRSGALRDSVGAQTEGLQAAVGSSDPAAVPQELGTARMPARPFLMPVAASMGEEVARAVAAAVVAALRGDSPDAGSARVDLCGDGPDGSDSLYGGAIAGGGALASTSSAKAPGRAAMPGLPRIGPTRTGLIPAASNSRRSREPRQTRAARQHRAPYLLLLRKQQSTLLKALMPSRLRKTENILVKLKLIHLSVCNMPIRQSLARKPELHFPLIGKATNLP